MRAMPMLAAALACAIAAAHEGAHQDAGGAAVATDDAPRWLDDDELFVPKVVQRLLGIRTVPASASAAPLRLLAEVVADPASRAAVAAPQAGRVTAAGAWPLPGQAVAAGKVLAWLEPVLTQREETQRRTELAQFEQALQIARINAERLRVQSGAVEGAPTTGNVYREQAELELALAQRRRELEQQALQARVALRAVRGGIVQTVAVRPGEQVATGQALFELVDPARPWFAAYSDDPRLAAGIGAASWRREAVPPLPVRLRGYEPLGGQPGWRLLFEPQAPVAQPLWPGQLGTIEWPAPPGSAAAAGCVMTADGGEQWTHVAAERFRVRRAPSCAELPAIDAHERVVVDGAALLTQYRSRRVTAGD